MTTSIKAAQTIALRRERSLTTLVAEEIERLILNSHLKPGDRINEKHLADNLSVSRGIVREARRGLERSGLLVSKPNRGVFVRTVSPEELQENTDMRSLLTGFLCSHAARKATPNDKEELQSLVLAMDEAISGENNDDYFKLNLSFHQCLMDIAQHERASSIYGDLVKESHLSRKLVLANDVQMRSSNAEHKEIVTAICNGDEVQAKLAGEYHVKNGYKRILDLTASSLHN